MVMFTAASFSPWFSEVLSEVSECASVSQLRSEKQHTLAGIFQGSRVVRWCHTEVHRSRFESGGEVQLEVHHPPVLFLQRGYGVNRSFLYCPRVLQLVPQGCPVTEAFKSCSSTFSVQAEDGLRRWCARKQVLAQIFSLLPVRRMLPGSCILCCKVSGRKAP